MRTTIELPDDLLEAAKRAAFESGMSLKQFFISALESRMAKPAKTRRDPPSIKGPTNMRVPAREEIDEAMFG